MKILIFITVFVISYVITYQLVENDNAYAIVKVVFLYVPFWLVVAGAVVDNLLPKKYFSEVEGKASIGSKTPKIIRIFYFFIMMVCLPLTLGFFVATVIAGKWI